MTTQTTKNATVLCAALPPEGASGARDFPGTGAKGPGKAADDGAPLKLRVLPGKLSILRFPPGALLPDWLGKSAFFSITRTREELSVVCDAAHVQPGAEKEEAGHRR